MLYVGCKREAPPPAHTHRVHPTSRDALRVVGAVVAGGAAGRRRHPGAGARCGCSHSIFLPRARSRPALPPPPPFVSFLSQTKERVRLAYQGLLWPVLEEETTRRRGHALYPPPVEGGGAQNGGGAANDGGQQHNHAKSG